MFTLSSVSFFSVYSHQRPLSSQSVVKAPLLGGCDNYLTGATMTLYLNQYEI